MPDIKNHSAPTAKDKLAWVAPAALTVSVLSLCIAAYAQYAARQATKATKIVETRQILSDFNNKGEALPGAIHCFNVALSMRDDELRTVFRDGGQQVEIAKPMQATALRCLQKSQTEKLDRLEDDGLDKFRRNILYKLNSFDVAFMSIRQGLGNKEDVCRSIWPSFSQGVSRFVTRVEELQPRPDEFQEMESEYAEVINAVRDRPCTSAS